MLSTTLQAGAEEALGTDRGEVHFRGILLSQTAIDQDLSPVLWRAPCDTALTLVEGAVPGHAPSFILTPPERDERLCSPIPMATQDHSNATKHSEDR